jgi:GR25 family glycosyltransferase involved in LPS biosynthesis
MDIRYYLIHCKKHNEREKHLKKIQNNLKQPIYIFEGVYTKNNSIEKEDQLNFLQCFDKKLNIKENFKFNLPGQIGCYLSHHLLIKKIKDNKDNKNLKSNYSVIFEDDVIWELDELNIRILDIINKLKEKEKDWDLIYLGNLNNNHGKNLTNNIYYLDPRIHCFGTHALLINNKNIEKIYEYNCLIRHEIDSHYKILIDNFKINGFVIYPPLCLQNRNLISNIK